MSEYNWCHGTKCHTYKTQSRVKGVGDNKVLRTRKIRINPNYRSYWQYFCSQNCVNDFITENSERIVALAPRHEPLETPVEIVKEKYDSYYYNYNGDNQGNRTEYQATRTIINNIEIPTEKN